LNKNGRKATLKQIAKNLVISRKSMGLSQKELAEKCGITSITVHNIENRKHFPHTSTLTVISLQLGVNLIPNGKK
jgi:transcriptional regulator with XRE-family HTH domain